jgi:uridine kinase
MVIVPTPAVPELAAVVLRRPPVGRVRLVCVDGYSGAGKTQLAGALAAALGGAPVVHLDDIYPGWDGLAAAIPLAVAWVAEPLAAGRAARWRRHDWVADRPGEWCEVPPADIVLLEGCGAGAAPLRAFASTVIWVDAAPEVRARRLRARADWAGYAPHLARWAAQEDALRAVDRTREHADVVVVNAGS